MPGPWWKVGRKSGRISEIVNDHLHKSRKRRDGSSLVVETGFPTSLVDLFMKNREKLKKPSKRKRNNNKPSAADGPFSFPPSSPAPSLPPPVDVNANVNVNDDTVPVADVESDGNSNTLLFLVAFKLLLVVFLVLSTNRLSIGVVTVSAFLFFHSDCLLGKYISDAKRLFTAVAQSIWRTIPFLNKLVEYKYGILPQEKKSMISYSPQEIVEESCNHPPEIQPEPMPGSSCSSSSPSPSFSKGKSVAVFQDDDPAVPQVRKIKKRTKIKNRLMKLLGKKSKTDSSDSSPKLGEESEVTSKQHSSISSRRYKISEDDTASSSAVLHPVDVSGSVVSSEAINNSTRDRRAAVSLRIRYFFLGPVILVGLVGGRPLAIFLVLLWIFLSVCVEKLIDFMRLSSVRRYFDKSR